MITHRPAVVFPGQGSLRATTAGLWVDDPAACEAFAEASDVLGRDVLDWWQSPTAIGDAVVAQLAVFVCGIAAHRSMLRSGLRPVVVAGHSIGEYTALVAGGALGFADLLTVVHTRALLMAEAAQRRPGGMAAVVGPGAAEVAADVVEMYRADGILVVANENGPQQVVLSGDAELIDRLETDVLDVGLRYARLRVAGAFHSPLMADAADEFDEVLAGLAWSVPEVAVIPNVDAEPTRDPARLAAMLRRQMLATVRWESTSAALGRLDVTQVVECGATATLGPLIRQVLPDMPTLLVSGAHDRLHVVPPRETFAANA